MLQNSLDRFRQIDKKGVRKKGMFTIPKYISFPSMKWTVNPPTNKTVQYSEGPPVRMSNSPIFNYSPIGTLYHVFNEHKGNIPRV